MADFSGMDPALQELFIGLISNGLTELAMRGGEDRASPISENAVEAAVGEAVGRLTDVEAVLPVLGGERLREFLRSAEAHNVVRQIFASADTKQIDEVEVEFYELWRARMDDRASASKVEVDRLFRALVDLCQNSLERAIATGNLTAIEARAAQRHAELRGAIGSLEQTLEMFATSGAPDAADVDEYAAKYRRQLAAREGSVTPPALDSARRVPIDSIYVPARLEELEDSSEPPLNYGAFSESLFRRVVLGNPGSGKSTLAKKLAVDLARDRLSLGRRPDGVVPFLVVLRDFDAQKRETRCSIVDFITATSNSRYQLPPPAAAIEYLLLTNRAMVIFDGLDELLDTSRRAEISGDVESFASLYPSAPILVTSREVGYQLAPLSPESFSAFRLAPFSEAQTQQYARNWFAIDGLPETVEEQAENFMSDSAGVADLRSNALMLGLMCNLYKGSGYIPRNRPDVYEACAVMLFDRWDRLRQIGKPLNIESLLRPAMQHLAAWIYADSKRRSGVTERDLIASASEFLHPRRFEHKEDAELEARKLIELCRGRAWVFTDTGTTRAGERLYQFTHTTFLEFFTAGHLVRTNPTAEKLLEVLEPRISEGEWDMVAQLAFQLLERNVEAASDTLLSALADPGGAATEAQANRLDFAVRSLEFLVPSPAVTKRLTAAAIDCLMRSLGPAIEVGRPVDESPLEAGLVKTVLTLLSANAENRRPIGDSLVESVGAYLVDPSDARYAAELALELKPGGLASGAAEREFSRTIVERMVDAHGDRLRELAEDDPSIGSDLLMLDAINPDRYVARHGVDPFLRERPFLLFPSVRRVPLAEIAIASLFWSYPEERSPESCLRLLAALAPRLTADSLAELRGPTGSWVFSFNGAVFTERQIPLSELSGDQRYTLLVLLAMYTEESIDRGGAVLPVPRSSPLVSPLLPVLLARESRNVDGAAAALVEIGLSEPQREAVLAWTRGAISLTPPPRGGGAR